MLRTLALASTLLTLAAPAFAQSSSAPEPEAALLYGEWTATLTFDTTFKADPDDGCVGARIERPEADLADDFWFPVENADGEQALAIWNSRSEVWGILRFGLGHTNDQDDVMYPELYVSDAGGEWVMDVDVAPLQAAAGLLHVEICHL